MSSFETGAIATVVVAPIAVPVAAVAGAGVAAAGVAATLGAAGVTAIGATVYAIIKTGIGLTKEVQALVNATKEEREMLNHALSVYMENVKKNEKEKECFLTKYRESISLDSLGVDASLYVDKIIDVGELNNLALINYYDGQAKELFFRAHQRGYALPEEDELYSLADELVRKLDSGVYSFQDIIDRYVDLIERSKRSIYAQEDESLISAIGPILFDIEYSVGNPLTATFYNELREALEHSESDEDKRTIVLNELLGKATYISSLMSNISCPNHELDDFNRLLAAIWDVIGEEGVSLRTKIDIIAVHYHNLEEEFKRISDKYLCVIEDKAKFDEYYLRYYQYAAILGLEPERIPFDFSRPKESIDYVYKKMMEIEKPAQERHADDLAMKTIRETMKKMNHRLISERDIQTKKGTLHQAVFHLENGNVVTVNVNNGRFAYSVSGVKIPGTSIDKGSIRQSMHLMCKQKRELYEALTAAGVEVDISESLDPENAEPEEIEIEDLSVEKVQFLRDQKNRRSRRGAAKAKKVGE